jgi:hypothetical protein
MKKGLSAIFILGLALFLNVSLQAQKSRTGRIVITEKASVKYGGVEAYTDGNGVLIEWQTEVESNNLGFYVYRISGNGQERINKALVSGGYMRGETNSSGKYSYFDAEGDLGFTYYIQSLDINGRVVSSRVIIPQVVQDLTAVAGVSSVSLKKSALAANSDSLINENELPDDLQSEVSIAAGREDRYYQRRFLQGFACRTAIRRFRR